MNRPMRILVIGKFYSEGFALHIAETLADMKHHVDRFEPGFKSGRAKSIIGKRLEQVQSVLYSTSDNIRFFRSSRTRELWNSIKSSVYDVALVCHDFLQPLEVIELKKHVRHVALWFPDHLGVFGRGYFMNAPYDAIFFKDPYLVKTLGKVLESPTYYLPECFNPQKHTLPLDYEIPQQYHCDLTTAGNQHPYRSAFLKHVENYDLKLWGNSAPLWLHSPWTAKAFQGRPVHNQEKVLAFRGAKIVLNNLHYGEVEGVNVRTFEAAGAAAFQLVDWRRGLNQLFTDGEEIISFKDVKHLSSLIEYYLPREAERRKIADAGFRRAMSEHTYQNRLDLLLTTVLGGSQGFPLPKEVG